MNKQLVLNTLARDIFRKQADFDYISARANFKLGLRQQFLWSAQQSIEKYLKAILLFNGKTARYYKGSSRSSRSKEFGHNLNLLLERVLELGYLKFDLPDWTHNFLSYLSELGGFNRYMSKSSFNQNDFLFKLDEIVWSIRRYCRHFPEKEGLPGLREASVNSANNYLYKEKPTLYNLVDGELEKILKRRARDEARKALVWGNLFYGAKNRKSVSIKAISSSEVAVKDRHWYYEAVKSFIIEDYIKP